MQEGEMKWLLNPSGVRAKAYKLIHMVSRP